MSNDHAKQTDPGEKVPTREVIDRHGRGELRCGAPTELHADGDSIADRVACQREKCRVRRGDSPPAKESAAATEDVAYVVTVLGHWRIEDQKRGINLFADEDADDHLCCMPVAWMRNHAHHIAHVSGSCRARRLVGLPPQRAEMRTVR